MERDEVPIPAIYRCSAKPLTRVVPRTRSWIWQDWIPRGALSLILGEPGIGKSFYALQLAAMVTRGWLNPPTEDLLASTKSAAATEGHQRDPVGGTVVLFDFGDGEQIAVERLREMGACLGNVVLVDRGRNDDLPDENGIPPFDPRDARPKAMSVSARDRELRMDLRSLEQHVLKLRSDGHDVRMVLLDPVESLLRDSFDKGLLAKLLGELAAKLDVAVVAIGISTFSKGLFGVRVDTRGIDALFHVARTVITIVQDLEHEQRRLVLPTKLNLSAMRPGLKFSIKEGAVEWTDEAVYLTGHEYLVLFREMLKNPLFCESSHELDRVTNWLRDQLDEGPKPSVAIRMEAYDAEVAAGTLRKAFKRLGCRSNKIPMKDRWIWKLPGTTEDVWGTTFNRDAFLKGE